MSPIEPVWDLVGWRLARDPRTAASEDELLLRIQSIWNSLPQADSQNLLDSLPRPDTRYRMIERNVLCDPTLCWEASGQGIGSWQACHEFEPSTTKDSPCRASMHVKFVESSNVLPLV
ncbi:hypothetical protein TNCV_3797521 [Trichonephila clavipes]|nr:hypothetical protein TNCV_3797521 [Trichonephila clavipes]